MLDHHHAPEPAAVSQARQQLYRVVSRYIYSHTLGGFLFALWIALAHRQSDARSTGGQKREVDAVVASPELYEADRGMRRIDRLQRLGLRPV